MYPEEMVMPMRQDLTESGFQELKTSEEVDTFIKIGGTALVVINSVCGCSAANARPAAKMSLDNKKIPQRLATVFAGVDVEATERIRSYMLPFPPSSPCIALFKDGELLHMLERHHIEGHPVDMIVENLTEAYNEFC